MEGSNQTHDPVLPTRDYTGVVNIGGKDLNCAVLSDGTRVLTSKAIFDAFERPRKGKSVVDPRGKYAIFCRRKQPKSVQR